MCNEDIKNVADLIQLVQQGEQNWSQYGHVQVRQHGDILMFNYTDAAESAGRWNAFERMSRGLMIHRQTGEIVARPFDKFFNWGRPYSTDAQLVCVTEKMDGSLGILYRLNGEYRIATKSSVQSLQAKWATAFLKNYDLSDLPDYYTLMFEVIYPSNRIVVDYGQRQDLVLIGARNRFTGEMASLAERQALAAQFGFGLPIIYQFASATELYAVLPTLDGQNEGYVAEFADGQFFKFKGQRYLELQSQTLSFNIALQAVIDGKTAQLLAETPDEFLPMVHDWLAEIEQTVQRIRTEVRQAFDQAPKDSQKIFATWVMQHHKPLSSYLFTCLKGQPFEQDIYKHAFASRQ